MSWMTPRMFVVGRIEKTLCCCVVFVEGCCGKRYLVEVSNVSLRRDGTTGKRCEGWGLK
jgi:hypothetical protein